MKKICLFARKSVIPKSVISLNICCLIFVQGNIAAGANEALYKGDTSWDWNVAARGSFEITISLGMEEEKLLKKALPKAIAVTETILSSGTAADRSMKTPQVTSKNSLGGHVHKPALAALVHPVKMKRPDNF